MRQKAANQMTKKNFILYKGHTGWKIKTRLFGTLLVSLSAVAIAESTGTVDVHAATETPSAEVASSSAPKTSDPAVIGTPSSAAAALKASEVAPAPSSAAPKPSETVLAPSSAASKASEAAPAASSAAPKPSAGQEASYDQLFYPSSISVEPESLSLNDAAADTPTDSTTDKQYQTLTPGQTVEVGKTDGSGVTLSGSQVQDHFTNTVQNFSKSPDPTTAAGNVDKNKTVQPADSTTGVWQLTTNGTHVVWSAGPDGFPMNIAGPQTAHVSFENEIDFDHDFSMTGALGIGTKTTGGADSVGIVFAPGDPEYATKGKVGGNLGLGGLDNAFAFVYDDHYNNGDDTSGVVDPGNSAYFGWRSTDANGVIQKVTDATAWKAASAFDLSKRATNPLIGFGMTYDSFGKVLSVTIQNQTFKRTLTGIDTTKGYSISIAASTGQDTNDYSARIDSFTYTPKTASVDVTVADSTAGDTPVSTKTPVTANIGDTISVFSTKAAAERAVAADPTLDPNLVTVIPTSTTNNVYVVDGDQTTASNGTVHYINDDSSIADGAYYSYKVTGDANQAFSVPISQAFTANVTPIDSVTGDPIPGMAPIQVTTVAGKSVVIQIPGYTPATVTLAAPKAGETVANDNVEIDTGTPVDSTATVTTSDVAKPIAHYYTASGTTIDGKTPVNAAVTVGTNQSVTDALNHQLATDGATAGVTSADYYWSTVPNAAGTDSMDAKNPQSSTSILVPTKSTLDHWLTKAADNQTQADTQQAKAQGIYDKFVAMPGVTQDQKDAAKKLLDSVTDLYNQMSDANATAKTSLEAAEASTDPATIVKDSQAGYNAIANMDNSLNDFQTDLDNLTDASGTSLASFVPWEQTYGTSLQFPDVTFGSGFGATVTDAQKKAFNNPDYFYYVDALDSDNHVTPKNAGTYYFKLTDAGRTYLKSLTSNTNAGLYVSATVTINPAAATPTINDANLVYGGVDGKLSGITASLGSTLADTDHPATQDEFEIVDAKGAVVPVDQLQVGGDYTIRYTDAAQTALKADSNYTFSDFGTAKLKVTARKITVTAPTVTKTYGDKDSTFRLTGVSSGELVNNDQLSDLGVTLERVTGEDVGMYTIDSDPASDLNKSYDIAVTPGSLTINKKSVTVTANNVKTIYNGTAPKTDGFSVPDNTLVGNDTPDDLGVTLNPISDSDVNAGTYTDAITGTATSKNYAVTVNPGTLTIAQATSSVDLGKADMVYGDEFPTFTSTDNVPGTTSVISAADFEVVDGAGKVMKAADVQANGKYTLQLTQAAKDRLDTENPNYAIAFGTNVLNVSKRAISVNVTDVKAAYDGTAPKTNGFSIAAGDALAGNDTLDALGVTLNPISEVNAGTYTDALTGTTTSNNYDVTVNPGTLTIAQAASSVDLGKAGIVYGDAFPTFTSTDNVPGTTSTITAGDFEVVDEAGNVMKAADVQANGKYTLQLTQTAQDRLNKENPNYAITFGTNTLTVSKRAISVNVTDVKAAYDGTAPKTNGFSIVAGDALAGNDTLEALGVTLNPISEVNAGTYTDALTGTTTSNNYDVTVNPGTLTIAQAASSVDLGKAGIVYGDAFPTFTSTDNVPGTTSTITAGDFEVVDEAGNVMKAADVQANGKYTLQLTQTAQDRLNKENPNYAITFGTNALTVNQRSITVQINDVDAPYDGMAHSSNGFVISSGKLANDDSNDALGVTLDPISETNAGTYAITGNANSANYKVTLENGALKISQVAGSVAVGNADFTYDDPSLPQLTATVSGPDVAIAQTDFEIIDNATEKSVVAADLQAGGNYTIQLTQAAKTRLANENPNYDFTDFGTGKLTVAKRSVTVTVANQVMNADNPTPENQSTVVVDGSPVHVQPQLDLSYEEPDGKEVGTYAIGAKSANSNYALTVVPGQLKVLGNVVGPDGSTTITEKDLAGNVVKIDKKWADGSQTTYVNNPATGNKTVTEQKNGAQVDQQNITDLTPGSKVTLSDGEGTNTGTIVALDPTTNLPVFEHDTTQTADDGTITTKDTNGNVVKVVKPWTDGSQTTYTYDPMTGKRTVTDQKDSQTVAEKDLEPKDTQATLSAGDVETIVDAGQPGSQPTFEHNTTQMTKDAAGNVTATTKDDAGNVIKVTKQWADGSQTDYTYDPATGKQSVTEQKDGKTVDTKTITPDSQKVTLATGDGVETTVDVLTPGAQPTFKHDTTQTAGDTTTTTDANGNVIKVVKQWPDDSQTTYTYDPVEKTQKVTEQRDGQTVDTQSITPDGKATLASGDDAKTIVNAGQPGSQPTFEHDTTQTTKDAAGNVTATTKDDTGNVIKVTKQWADGSQTDYTYDPAKKTQTVTEQKDGKIVDTKAITPDAPKATLSTGAGVETLVDAEKPGAAPTFKHDTTQTNGDTTITKDANGNVIKAVKQWPDDSQTTYTYDPATGDRNVTEQKDGKTVDTQSIAPAGTKATLKTSNDVQTIVNAGEPGSQPTFEHDTTKVTKDDAGNVTATTKDNSGNVIKVVKQWTDGSQTSYTYDPVEKTQSVTEQKDGKTVDQKTFDKGSTKETLTNGGGVEPLVETFVAVLAPGTEPTFTHNTTQTATDKAGNVTDTTKDAAGNVINVTKQWTDGSKTTYAYDPTTGNGIVTEQKDGKTVDTKTITSDTPKATLSAGDGVDTLVDAGQPGSEPTFAHNTTQTTTDKAGNVTATTKDAAGNVINVTKQWTDGGKTTYVYDPTTGNRTVTEEKAGKTVDQKTISPDETKTTLSAGDGIDTLVDAGQPGAEPTFEHDTTQSTKDAAGDVTATTKDADGNVVKVTKRWTDGSQTAYTYDPTTGKQTVTEQKDGKTVDQKAITADAPKATLKSGNGVESTVTADKPGAEPTFAHDTTQTTTDKAGNVTDTTKDATGNVVKVTKHWTDGSQTAYTYDPATGQQTVTEQKGGQTVDQQAIADGKATLKSGDGVESIVTVDKPGAAPTFAHETTRTATDKAGNVTDTTKDADGNVVKVTKHWTDSSETDYIYDPTTGNRTVTEQKDGKIVDQQTIAPDGTKATLKSGDGVETIVNAGQPGSQPTFAHDTTQTATDKFGNVTATTKDANGNVIKVTKRWTDGSETTYAYNPATGQRTVTEQNNGKLVDRQTIAPDSSKATLASGDGVETIVHTGQPGSQPTFEHETTQITKDAAGNVTATTKDTDGDVVKVAKQWTDGSETIYAYDPTTGQRTVAEQRDGKTVDQQTIVPGASAVTLSDGAGGTATVKFAQSADAMPTFTHAPASHSTGVSVPTNNDADKKAVKVTKQWPDGIQVIYTYDPMSGQRTVRELKKGKLVAQRTMASGDVDAILPDGMGGTTTVKFDESETEPIFTRQLADKINSRKVTSQKKTSKKSLKNAGATRNLQKQAGAAKALLNATGHRSAQTVSAGHAGATAVTGRRQSQQQTMQQQANQQETELPQTGQKNESFLAQLGVILLALLITPFVRRRSH